jgi:hypothetical protein
MGIGMMPRMPAKYFAVIVRLDRTIQYAAACRSNAGAGDYWMPAGACHRAAQSADPLAGMTTENVEGT